MYNRQYTEKKLTMKQKFSWANALLKSDHAELVRILQIFSNDSAQQENF